MIEFRKVTINDIKLLYYWLNKAHVKEFWDPDECFSFEQIYNKYSNRLKENKIELYIVLINSIDVGFIQTYFVENLTLFKIQGIAKGIDLYIGDTDFLHKGYGKLILREFIDKFVFSDDSVQYTVIDPEERNTSAIKAYKKAGFRHANTAYNEYEKAMCCYMTMSRAEFFCNL